MPRPAAKLLGPLAGLLLAFHGFFALRGYARAWDREPDWRGVGEIALAFFSVLLVSAVGRIVLAWLPAGPQGSHTPRHLPLTWAVSYLLGLVVVHVERVVLPTGEGLGYALLLAVPWVVLLVARVLTLPAAMVPRHEPRHERPGPAALALQALALAWVGAVLLLRLRHPVQDEFLLHADPYGTLLGPFGLEGGARLSFQLVAWLALWLVLAHGLEQARRAPTGIAIFVVVGLMVVTPYDDEQLLPAVHFGTGAAFLVGWLRRADRRACWLSAIGFGGCVVAGEPTLALAGLLTLAIASWPGQRKYALVAAGSSFVVLGLTSFLALKAYAWFQGWYPWSPSRGDIIDLGAAMFVPLEWGAAWLLFVAALVIGAITRVRSRTTAREPLALLLLFVLGCLALFPLVWAWSDEVLLVHLFPVAMLFAGLVWIREEEPS